jgi:hypothetical protein
MTEVAQEVASEVKAVAVEVESETKAAVVKASKVAQLLTPEMNKTKVAVSAEEHNIVLKMENEFLKVTTQITQLQRQAENIQKNFPEYLKSLAAKYSVDLTKNTFDALEGAFKRNQ